ncbi:hypothetical protein [Aureispira anguillae]|uniref:Uncharacterized protein n=1 Tax=Aureispira anguillae TaxID=2864201 RepID=A0A915YEB0_9BACT|nr:hypothetical protein [Aureispira anguillae]BDS11479.1 hypothetical protein AsAng_0021930 [Aureispira anguillae]
MNKETVNKFEKVQGQIEGFYKEIGILSKKNPNDAVNKFKLKFINQILVEANELLQGLYKPLKDFDFFEEDDIPTNSDVTMIFEQYLACLEKLRSDNIILDFGNWYWIINGKSSSIKTSEPKKIRNK